VPAAEWLVDQTYLGLAWLTGDAALRQTVLETRLQDQPQESDQGPRLQAYVTGQLQNPEGDFVRIVATDLRPGGVGASEDYAHLSGDFKRLSAEEQDAFIALAGLLLDLNREPECPEKKAKIVGRAVFEALSFFAPVGRAGKAGRLANAAQGLNPSSSAGGAAPLSCRDFHF
jgi:hypothetical protein